MRSCTAQYAACPYCGLEGLSNVAATAGEKKLVIDIFQLKIRHWQTRTSRTRTSLEEAVTRGNRLAFPLEAETLNDKSGCACRSRGHY